MRKRLAGSARAFSATAHNPSLLRAQLAFGAAWTAEWAFTVAIGVVAFRDGGAAAQRARFSRGFSVLPETGRDAARSLVMKGSPVRVRASA